MEKNLQEIGLEMEPAKTNIVVFNNRREEKKISVKIKNLRISNVRSARFLGITFDEELNFEEHLTEIKARTVKT